MRLDVASISKAIRSAHNGILRPELDKLRCLTDGITSSERAQRFLDILREFVEANFHYLQTTSRPRVADLANLRANPETLKWGVLYWRYFCKMTLRTNAIAKLSGIGIRQIRRYLRDGLHALSARLTELERSVRRKYAHERNLRSAEQRLSRNLANEQMKLVHKIETHLQSGNLVMLGGSSGTGKSSILFRLYELMHPAHKLVWVEAQPEYLDQHGQLQKLRGESTAEALVAQMYEGLGLFEHSTIDDQIEAIDAYPENIIFAINRVDALPQLELQKLIECLKQLPRHKFVITTRRFIKLGGNVMSLRVPQLKEAQSRDILECARRSKIESSDGLEPLTDSQFNRLYKLVGGLPLALSVLGTHLAHTRVEQAIQDLKNARPPFDALYTYALKSTWKQLSPSGRDLVRYLSSRNGGQSSEEHLSKLDIGSRVASAITELTEHYLIDIEFWRRQRFVRLMPLMCTAIRSEMDKRW